MKYTITEEEQNRIKLYSAMNMPDNPSEKGMSPSSIKKFFYKFLDPLFQVLNAHLGLIGSGITDALSEHDASEIAHNYLITLIRDLQTQNTEQGTAITEHYTEVKKSIANLKDEIDTDIDRHDKNNSAHGDIRQEIKNILKKAQDAHNLASGKAKIYPVSDVEDMLSQLNDDINVGDKFILSDAKVPDFTLFAKNFEFDNDSNVDDISNKDISTYNFIVGRNYHYNGYLLVPSESGIDTSEFVKASDFEEVRQNFEELLDEIETWLCEVETKINSKSSTFFYENTDKMFQDIATFYFFDPKFKKGDIIRITEKFTPDYSVLDLDTDVGDISVITLSKQDLIDGYYPAFDIDFFVGDIIAFEDLNIRIMAIEDGQYVPSTDTALNTNSTNPVENRVVARAIENIEIKYKKLQNSDSPILLENNTIYVAEEPITKLYADLPTGENYICSLTFEVGENYDIRLYREDGEILYLTPLDFESDELWEINIMNNIVASGKVSRKVVSE